MGNTPVQSFYRYHAYVYDWTRWTILHGRRRAVTHLNLRPDSSVLEIGCGTGLNFSYVLSEIDPCGGKLVGVDFSADMLKQARKRVTARGFHNVELIEADATKLDLGRRFDAVFFAYSLTMIPEWPLALERAREHLLPGGRVVVLDFGRFKRWGPLGSLMRGWLRLNHVETMRPYVDEFRRVFDDAEVYDWLGGYSFIAVGKGSG